MFGSIALIGNSFSISVNERKRQYGLLSSIGATRKQLRRNVLYEASVLSVIGIPRDMNMVLEAKLREKKKESLENRTYPHKQAFKVGI